MTEKYHLKITSAVVIDGSIRGADSIVEVGERVAKDLLQRGKAIVATVADAEPEPEKEPEAEPKPARKPKADK